MYKWQQNGFFLGEEGYRDFMETEGALFRKKNYEEGDFAGCDFRNIHYYKIKNEAERAAIVISHGFCEFIHKYDEAIYYFYQLGYSIYFVDHRGHGHSYRAVDAVDLVHADSFMDYVDDFRYFMDLVVKKESPEVPLFLFCHSMGGGIGAAFLEKYPGYFKAAVLSSPMLEMSVGKHKPWFVKGLVFFSHLTGRYKSFGPGNHGYDGVSVFETSSAQSKARYDYFFDYRGKVPEFSTYGGSYGWIGEALKLGDYARKNAGKVQIPVLLCQAGLDRLVNPGGQDYFARESGDTQIVQFPNAKHEIFNAKQEDREAYYNLVFRFLEQSI